MAVTNVNTEAKDAFASKIINLFPNDFIGTFDKKYYFWSNGIQVCMALTCPKTPVGESNSPPSAFPQVEEKEIKNTTVEYTPEERATIEKLMASLGI
jgi:hypothetical protein